MTANYLVCNIEGQKHIAQGNALWYYARWDSCALKGQKHYYINASSINFINSYVIEKNVIEEALKERHLKGQSGFACDLSLRRRAVVFVDIYGMRSVGPTPRVIVYRCRTYSAPLIIYPHLTALTDCPIRRALKKSPVFIFPSDNNIIF